MLFGDTGKSRLERWFKALLGLRSVIANLDEAESDAVNGCWTSA